MAHNLLFKITFRVWHSPSFSYCLCSPLFSRVRKEEPFWRKAFSSFLSYSFWPVVFYQLPALLFLSHLPWSGNCSGSSAMCWHVVCCSWARFGILECVQYRQESQIFSAACSCKISFSLWWLKTVHLGNLCKAVKMCFAACSDGLLAAFWTTPPLPLWSLYTEVLPFAVQTFRKVECCTSASVHSFWRNVFEWWHHQMQPWQVRNFCNVFCSCSVFVVWVPRNYWCLHSAWLFNKLPSVHCFSDVH